MALSAADKVMGKLIAAHPPSKLARRQPPFHVLAVSVINQQLSQKAAESITARVAALSPTPFAAAAVNRLSTTALRQAGLSGSKVTYLRELAKAHAAGVLNEAALRKLSDDDIITQLTAVRGIGVWTAEMFLMFGMRRADVLSLGDAGLRRAARLLYGRRFRGDDATVLEKAAKSWRPWRTVACWHLWKSLDGGKT